MFRKKFDSGCAILETFASGLSSALPDGEVIMLEDQLEVIPANDVAVAVVARAEMMLSVLSQKAAAARAEADCAELRLLLAEARSGNPQRLTRWLEVHGGHEFPSSPHVSSNRLSSTRHVQPVGPAQLVGSIDSWDQLLPAVRERLRRRSVTSKIGPNKKAAGTSTGTSQAAVVARPGAVKSPDNAKSSRGAARSRQAPVARSQPAPACAAKPIPGLAENFSPQQLQQQQYQHRRWQRLRGVVASFAAHLGLVWLLAFVTLRLPVPPASLALETSPHEVATETVEISQLLEVESPETPAELNTAPQAMDVSESLAAVNSTLGTSGETAPTTAVLSAAALGITSSNLPGSSVSAMSQNATFFGAAASGNCFCYVIDGSASMRGGPWEAAKAELLKSLLSLKEKQRFYLVFFNRELSAIPLPGERQPAPYALYATPENLQHARRWIDTLRIEFGAPPNDALELAISKEPDAIYLLTDGATQVDVLGFLRRQNRVQDLIFGEQIRVPIHTIAFYSLEGQELLRNIAAENNGRYIYVPDPRKR